MSNFIKEEISFLSHKIHEEKKYIKDCQRHKDYLNISISANKIKKYKEKVTLLLKSLKSCTFCNCKYNLLYLPLSNNNSKIIKYLICSNCYDTKFSC